MQEREYGPDHRALAMTLYNLGGAYGHLGDAVRQRDLQERALAMQERALAIKDCQPIDHNLFETLSWASPVRRLLFP